jgi:pantoate--beta-alanine ligase
LLIANCFFMLTLTSASELTALSRQARRSGKRIGFVPTMGALHQGHISLVRAARSRCDVVTASIFVNPAQFGPNEDFAKYPRSLEADCAMLAAEKTDVLFAPAVEEIYPAGASVWVDVEGLCERLDGRSRPGHFRGVATVVAKLFNIVQPHLAFFGQKDAAQAAVIRKMVRDLRFDLEIVVCPIVREPDGLAMSSRNAYLSAEERKQAAVLSRSLMHIQALSAKGERNASRLAAAGRRVMKEEPSVRLDYYEVVNPDTLEPVPDTSQGALVAVAAYFGSTRLIDNLVLQAR